LRPENLTIIVRLTSCEPSSAWNATISWLYDLERSSNYFTVAVIDAWWPVTVAK
jgi:hypothetical protein